MSAPAIRPGAAPRVRRMQPGDAAAVAGLATQLGYPSGAEQIARRFGDLAGDSTSALFVAESADGRIVGWVHVKEHRSLENDPCAELAGLVVDGASRRQGVGRALVAAADAWAAERGFALLRLRSNTARAEARPFYEGLGFVIRKTHYAFERPTGRGGRGEVAGS